MKIAIALRYYLSLLSLFLCSLNLLHALSETELAQLKENKDEIYIYCDKKHSKITEFISEISKLDKDKNSPVWQLHDHIKKGFSIGRRDAIVEALGHAEKTLDKNSHYLTKEKVKQIQAILSSIIKAITTDKLIVVHPESSASINDIPFDEDFEAMRSKDSSKDIKVRKPVSFFKHVKFKNNVKFVGDATFEDGVKFTHHALFEKNVKIKGSLSVSDETIDCDLTVGCNINMNNSSGSNIGNIVKNGTSFIHNFGTQNTFVGIEAGNFNMSGQSNSGFGAFTLSANQNGFYNVASGLAALNSNQSGSVNTAIGTIALASNVSGDANTAIGFLTMVNNISGSGNTVVGTEALFDNNSGDNNTVIGSGALDASTTGSRNIAIGFDAGSSLVTGSDNIYIGADGVASESGIIRIGTFNTHNEAFMQGIFGQMVASGGLSVEVDITGHLGTSVSSNVFKKNIHSIDTESEKIYRLRPVAFSYKRDATNTEQYGLIAEEVAEIFPSLVVNDKDGKPYAVRYQVLPVLLLNELQKQQVAIEDQKIAIQDLIKRVGRLEARRISRLEARI